MIRPLFLFLCLVAASSSQAGVTSLIDEIIVEAQAIDRTLNETHLSVVVRRDIDIASGTDRTLTELYRRIPNVTVAEDGDIVIRGVDRNGVGGALSTHAHMYDEAWSPFGIGLWDIEHVEIMRGTDTHISAVTSGATAIRFQQPTTEPTGHAMLSYAPSTETLHTGIASGGAIGDGGISYRTTFEAFSRSGYLTNSYRDDDAWDDDEDYRGRVILRWRPKQRPNTSVNVHIIHNQLRSGGSNLITLPAGAPAASAFSKKTEINTAAETQRVQSNIRLHLDHPINDRWQSDVFLGIGDQKLFHRVDSDPHDQTFGQSTSESEVGFVGLEARFARSGQTHNQHFRAFLYRQRISTSHTTFEGRADLDGPNGPLRPIQTNHRFSSPTPFTLTWGIGSYSNTQIKRWNVDFSILLTGQRTRGNRPVHAFRSGSTGDESVDSLIDAVIGNFFPEADSRSERIDSTKLLPGASVSYQLTSNARVGVRYQRSRRLGWLSINLFRQRVSEYDDEVTDSFETFLRSAFFDRRLVINATLFYTRIKDQQVFAFLTDNAFDAEIVNAQRSLTQGAELDVWWQGDRLSTWFSAGLLDARYDKFVIGPPCCLQDWSGQQFANAADWTLAYGFSYDLPANFFISVDAHHQPTTPAGAGNNVDDIQRERRTIFNARVGRRLPAFELSIFARNLLNERYLNFYNARDGVARIGHPRELGVTLRARW